MGTFIADGAAVLPVVKTDVRIASIPPDATEWAAADANQIREALLDLRSNSVSISTGTVSRGSGWTLGNASIYKYGQVVSLDIGLQVGAGESGNAAFYSICAVPSGYRPNIVIGWEFTGRINFDDGTVYIGWFYLSASNGNIGLDYYIDGNGVVQLSTNLAMVDLARVNFSITYITLDP